MVQICFTWNTENQRLRKDFFLESINFKFHVKLLGGKMPALTLFASIHKQPYHDCGTFTNGLDGNTIATPGARKLFLK